MVFYWNTKINNFKLNKSSCYQLFIFILRARYYIVIENNNTYFSKNKFTEKLNNPIEIFFETASFCRIDFFLIFYIKPRVCLKRKTSAPNFLLFSGSQILYHQTFLLIVLLVFDATLQLCSSELQKESCSIFGLVKVLSRA